MANKKKEPLVKKDSELLPVKLTEPEVTEFGRQMAKLERDLRILQGEKKDSAADFKLRESKVDLSISDVATKIRDGQEYRQVETETTYDIASCTSTTKRTDTGEVVLCATMTAEEIRAASSPELPFNIVRDGALTEVFAG